MRLAALVVCVVAAAAGVGEAHDRTTSYSDWDVRGRDATVRATLAARDVTRFPCADAPDAAVRAADYVADRLRLFAGDAPCAVVEPPRRTAAAPVDVAWRWQVRCPPSGALRVETTVLFDVAPAHLHFARVTRDGGAAVERVLTDGDREWLLDAAGGLAASGFIDWVRLGVAHILSGADHLVFLLALLMIATSAGDVVRVVTGFTVGHSVTLAAAVLGWARPDRAAIEAVIGLSIAFVAAENVWLTGRRRAGVPVGVVAILATLGVAAGRGAGNVPAATLLGLAGFAACYFALLGRVARPAVLRWLVALLFGLVHGFGFAAVLSVAGLDGPGTLRALAGFNAGVELGQLAVVALAFPVLGLLFRDAGAVRRPAVEVASAAVLGIGVFWFVSRAFG